MLRQNQGFTVIELMVTVAVMLVLIAIAQPSFEGLAGKFRVVPGEHLMGVEDEVGLGGPQFHPTDPGLQIDPPNAESTDSVCRCWRWLLPRLWQWRRRAA